MSIKDHAAKMTFVVYIDPEKGEVEQFLNCMATNFIKLFDAECEAHSITNLTPAVLAEARAEHEADPLEAMWKLPPAADPEIKDDDDS